MRARVLFCVVIVPLVLSLCAVGQWTRPQAYRVRFVCNGPVAEASPFRVNLLPLPPTLPVPVPGCDPVPCDRPLLNCELRCAPRASDGGCDPLALARQLCECVRMSNLPIQCEPAADGSVLLKGYGEFLVVVTGPELGARPGACVGLPLWPECPVNNLCDGIAGNERERPVGGVSVTIERVDLPPPTWPSPQPTKTQAPPTATPPCRIDGPVVQRTALDIDCKTPFCRPVTPDQPCGSFQVLLFAHTNRVVYDCETFMADQPPLVSCDVPCVSVLDNVACDTVRPRVLRTLVECINSQGHGRLCAMASQDGALVIQATVPFVVVVVSNDPGRAPTRMWPVFPECPVVNLCDGILGNERSTYEAGLAIRVRGGVEPTRTPETPMPTRTAPPTRTVEPTRTLPPECVLTGLPLQREIIQLCCENWKPCTPDADTALCRPFRLVVQPVSDTVGADPCSRRPLIAPLAVCEVPCGLPLDPTAIIPPPPERLCPELVPRVLRALAACISAQGNGRVCARLTNAGLEIESVVPFEVLIDSDELGFPPGLLASGLPVRPQCPVNNLCNGVAGDERRPHQAGLCVRMVGERPTLTPLPTRTVPETRTVVPTRTAPPTRTPPPPDLCVLPVLPVQRSLLEICCAAPLGCGIRDIPCFGPLRLVIQPVANLIVPDPCAPRTILAPLADCIIPCDWPPSATEWEGPELGCEEIVARTQRLIVRCINGAGSGRVCASLSESGAVKIESVVPFEVLIDTPELGLPPSLSLLPMGLPVKPGCPLNNLCNGVMGDERKEHQSGLCFRVRGEPVPPTYTSVPTRTIVPTRTAQPTRTIVPTRTVLPSRTPVPTRTPSDVCELGGPPRVSAVLRTDCLDPWVEGPAFRLHVLPRFALPLAVRDATPCGPVRLFRDLGQCKIGTPAIDVACPLWAGDLAERIAACLNAGRLAQHGYLCATVLEGKNAVRIDSVVPVLLALSGDELGLPERSGLLLLPDCPVNNLFDGTKGNERAAFVQGASLSIEYLLPPVPTPTPRCTCPDPAVPGGAEPGEAGSADVVLLDPWLTDSDGDGVLDGIDTLLFGAPGICALLDPGDVTDTDGDRLPALLDPDDTNPDTDGDGVADGYEALRCQPQAVVDSGLRPPIGDVNCDGVVSNLDALYIQTYFMGLREGDAALYAQGDLDLDGAISNQDALIAHAWFMRIVRLLPL